MYIWQIPTLVSERNTGIAFLTEQCFLFYPCTELLFFILAQLLGQARSLVSLHWSGLLTIFI